VADSRMQRGEFVEVLKFDTKAKKLYADVENIAQILAICEVHNAALNKLSRCEKGILQTERLSMEKKQYRKLAYVEKRDSTLEMMIKRKMSMFKKMTFILQD